MDIKPLKIGDLEAKLPIIQGGMGIGISLSNLASAVANCGGIGIISAAQIGYDEEDFETNAFEANLKALRKHIKLAKAKAPKGIIGVNLMVAMKNYEEYALEAIKSGVDLIISGAGLPTSLPKIARGYKTKIAPIVSSLKAASVILKIWDKKHNAAPDMIVVEGPKAGGHLGFHKEDIEKEDCSLESVVPQIIEAVKPYEEKYNKNIPIIAAGGIYDGFDVAKFLKLGAQGVQMGTRFVATEECDAHINFKKAYINSSKEDISIVKSPVGMPGRAILNSFTKTVEYEKQKIDKCYNCLIPCNPKETPYCITNALINAAKGNMEKALIFAGDNAYKVNKIVSVKELMHVLESEIMISIDD